MGGLQTSLITGKAMQKWSVAAGMVRVRISGFNFGASDTDILSLHVRGSDCTTRVWHNSSVLTCVSGEVDIFKCACGSPGQGLKTSDIVIRTSLGTTDTMPILNHQVRLAEGYSAPMIASVEVECESFRPHALTLDERRQILYFSDTAANKIRRVHTSGKHLSDVATDLTNVFGLAFDPTNSHLYFTHDSNNDGGRISLLAGYTVATYSSHFKRLRWSTWNCTRHPKWRYALE